MTIRPTALVTGASSGIGEAYAERLARDGHDLIVVARRSDRLEALAARLSKETGVSVEPMVADLADRAALARVEARIVEDERLAVLVNNAGFGAYRRFAEIDAAVADSLIEVHIRAVVRLTRAALPGMLKRDAGAIVNIASLLALSGTVPPDPLPMRAVYAGAKAFQLAFTQTLAGELGKTRVKVQCCLPGLVATEFHTVQGVDMSRMPRMSSADVVQACIAGLARGEVVCVPALEDAAVFDQVGEAQRAVLPAARQPAVAARYRA